MNEQLSPEHYILATGGRDVKRLKLLQEVYGPGTESLFRRSGLHVGQRLLEVGCGSGNISCWLAQQVGPAGGVVGIDNSAEQVQQARQQASQLGLTNVEFHVADAYAPGLLPGSFDIAYCRLVLMHLTHPLAALQSMRSLVKPGGLVLCEEMDLGHWLCDPPAEAMAEFFRLNEELGRKRQENFDLGASLHQLFRQAGLTELDVGSNFAMVLEGEKKRLLWMTFVEFAPELVREGLATQAHVERVAAELKQLADDHTTLFGFPLVVQVSGRVS